LNQNSEVENRKGKFDFARVAPLEVKLNNVLYPYCSECTVATPDKPNDDEGADFSSRDYFGTSV
jgi:hypothetical protein